MSFENLQFAQDDARIIADKLKDFYEAVRRAHGEPGFRLALAAPERLMQLTEAAVLAQVNHAIDYAGKSSLLYFADDNSIEHIGYLYGERGKRMDASYALTTIRYTLSVERSVKTVIPKGYRITPDNQVFFATLQTLEIQPGELYGDIEAQCLTPGVIGDGFDVGEIKNMVDLVPFVASAENITLSNSGAEKEDLEEYRARLQMLPESFSVAGPDGAYEFWAKTANPGIIDTKAWMPEHDMESFAAFLAPWGITDPLGFYQALGNYYRESGTGPGNVNVTALMKGGELPSGEVLSQIEKSLSSESRRPMTDYVHVVEPKPISYNISFQYWIEIERATEATSIINAVNNAVDMYIAWQQSRLGLDINPDILRKLVMNCGVKRIEVAEPVFTVLEINEVAQYGGEKTVTYEGLEDA